MLDEQVAIAHSQQLHIYAQMAAERFDETDRIAGLRFVVITKTKSPSVSIHNVSTDEANLSAVVDRIEGVWTGITAGAFPANPGWQCSSCAFAQNCDAAAI